MGDQRSDQSCAHPFADASRIADRIIESDVSRFGADADRVIGIVRAQIPLTPADRAAAREHHQRMRWLLASDGLTQLVQFPLNCRISQVPPGYVRLAEPQPDQFKIFCSHRPECQPGRH